MDCDCDTYREALSARLDGEPGPVADDALDEHLDACAACRSWQQRAAELSRTLRVRSVQPTPDLTEAVLRTATPLRDRLLRRWPRVLLGCVALAQVVLGATQALGPEMGHSMSGPGMGSMTEHLFNESTSWNLALGVGMLWSAVRVRASAGLLPPLVAFLAVLTGFSAYDLMHGEVPVSRLVSHGLLVLGLILLLMINRDGRRWKPGPQGAHNADDGAPTAGESRADEVAVRKRRPYRSASPAGGGLGQRRAAG